MVWTRRRFLKILGIAAGGAVLAGSLAYRTAKSGAAEYYRKLVELPAGEAGAIDDATLATLMTATIPLLVEGIDLNRYEDFFRWHAQNAPGYFPLYRQFHTTMEEAAKSTGAPSFAEASVEIRKNILERAAAVRRTINEDDKVGGLKFALFEREWLLYERYIVREILTLFGRTDAWLLAGYGHPPGVPRGLELYKNPPRPLEQP
jgi:hypothetical protein